LGPVAGEVLAGEELVDLLPALLRIGRGEEGDDLVRLGGAARDVQPDAPEPLGVLGRGSGGDLLLLDALVDVLVDLLRERIGRLRLVARRRERLVRRRGGRRVFLRGVLAAGAESAQREDEGSGGQASHHAGDLRERWKSSCDGCVQAKIGARPRCSRCKRFVRPQETKDRRKTSEASRLAGLATLRDGRTYCLLRR